MAEVRFYYQERADGGQRSGLYVDGEPALESFVPGADEPDPKLLWYVDLVWETDNPPASQEEARAWLATHAADVRKALSRAADELVGGIDVDLIPWQWDYQTDHGPIRVSASAMRRFAAVDVSRRVRELADRWAALQPTLIPVG